MKKKEKKKRKKSGLIHWVWKQTIKPNSSKLSPKKRRCWATSIEKVDLEYDCHQDGKEDGVTGVHKSWREGTKNIKPPKNGLFASLDLKKKWRWVGLFFSRSYCRFLQPTFFSKPLIFSNVTFSLSSSEMAWILDNQELKIGFWVEFGVIACFRKSPFNFFSFCIWMTD